MTNGHPSHSDKGPSTGHPDEAGLEELLRQVGVRDEPSADLARDVHAAVHSEWRAMLDERRRKRRTVAWGVAASFALALLIATFGMRLMTPDPVPVATITLIDGQLLAASGEDAWNPRTAGHRVALGESIHTGERSRASVAFGEGLSVRLDWNTTLTLAATDRIVLDSGAVYVDSIPGTSAGTSTDRALTVQAHAGSVRHIGTQYEVRTHANHIEVSVREGRVMITNPAGTSTGDAGEKIRVTSGGEVTRTALSPLDPAWRWAMSVAPPFDIEDQLLSVFLQWVARETGRRLVYSSPQVESAAEQVKLRGSIAGLELDTALAAVLSTTQLRRAETEDDVIGITSAP